MSNTTLAAIVAVAVGIYAYAMSSIGTAEQNTTDSNPPAAEPPADYDSSEEGGAGNSPITGDPTGGHDDPTGVPNEEQLEDVEETGGVSDYLPTVPSWSGTPETSSPTGSNDTVDADTSDGAFNRGDNQSIDDYREEFTSRLSL